MAYTPEESRYLEAVKTQEFGPALSDLQAPNWQSNYPNFSWEWPTGKTNPRVTDKTTGQLLQTGSQASGDSFVDKLFQSSIPLMGAAITGGAAGMGPLAGAGGAAGSLDAGTPLWQQPTAGGVPDTGFGASVNAPGAGGGGGFTDSIMNNPYAGGGGVGQPLNMDFSGAGLGNLGAGTGGVGMAGPIGAGATAGLADAGQGGSLFDTISNFLKTPIGGAVGNAATSLFMSKGLSGLAGQQGKYSSLDQSQRQPYQGNLSQLINNPNQYLSNDPFATSLAAMYRDKVIPRNVAASGNPGQVIDEKGSQFVNALAGNYNTQVGNLSGIAGFGFPQSQYAGYGAGQLGAGAVQQGGNAIAGLGNAFGQNFGKILQGQAGSEGPFGTRML